VIILGIFILPRMLRKQPDPEIKTQNSVSKLNGWARMAILVSILWLAFFTLYLKPWNNEWHIFIYVGPGPVILSWGIYWVFQGFKKRRN
jgi:hypothetical protein